MARPGHQRTLNSAAATEAAGLLWSAWTSGQTLDALPPALSPITLADAMAVQLELRGLAGPSAGWKIAGTSPGGRAMLGSDSPMAAPLPAQFRHGESDSVPVGVGLDVVEPEIAFVLARDIPRPLHAQDLSRCVGSVHLALEFPDARHRHVDQVGALANLADLALAGRWIMGPRVATAEKLRQLDLRRQGVDLFINDHHVASGAGQSVLGSPWLALAWLARELSSQDQTLRAGDIVLSGSLTVPQRIEPGDQVRAIFAGLGSVSATLAHAAAPASTIEEAHRQRGRSVGA